MSDPRWCRACGDPLPVTVTMGGLCHDCRPRRKRDLVDEIGRPAQPEGCDACQGTGAVSYIRRGATVTEPCDACGGSGVLEDGQR